MEDCRRQSSGVLGCQACSRVFRAGEGLGEFAFGVLKYGRCRGTEEVGRTGGGGGRKQCRFQLLVGCQGCGWVRGLVAENGKNERGSTILSDVQAKSAASACRGVEREVDERWEGQGKQASGRAGYGCRLVP